MVEILNHQKKIQVEYLIKVQQYQMQVEKFQSLNQKESFQKLNIRKKLELKEEQHTIEEMVILLVKIKKERFKDFLVKMQKLNLIYIQKV